MIRRLAMMVLLAAAFVTAAGCSKRHRVQIESDGCWNGMVNDEQYISDCGNSTYRVLGTLRCVKVQRTSPQGSYLRLRIDDRPWADTPDAYGYLQVCN